MFFPKKTWARKWVLGKTSEIAIVSFFLLFKENINSYIAFRGHSGYKCHNHVFNEIENTSLKNSIRKKSLPF